MHARHAAVHLAHAGFQLPLTDHTVEPWALEESLLPPLAAHCPQTGKPQVGCPQTLDLVDMFRSWSVNHQGIRRQASVLSQLVVGLKVPARAPLQD